MRRGWDAIARSVSRRKSGLGAKSVKLGNGAIQALGLLDTNDAVAELSRLKTRIRYRHVVERITETSADLAARRGLSEEELEEIALPTYGLGADGSRRLPIEDGAAIMRVAGSREVELRWERPDGRSTQAVPKALKQAAPQEVAAARRLRKEIERTLAGQSARIERLYLSQRRLTCAQWRERYLDHPLISALARRLIWRFDLAAGPVAGMARGAAIEDVAGNPIDLAPDTMVTLWHPLTADIRRRSGLARAVGRARDHPAVPAGISRIYPITADERRTDVCSNRFAARILRQHPFKALCDQRGWRYTLMGDWNSFNTPTRDLPALGLAVELRLETFEEVVEFRSDGVSRVQTSSDRPSPVPRGRRQAGQAQRSAAAGIFPK